MPLIRRQPCVFGHRLLRNLKLQKINYLKKLKINYLLIGIVTLLLAAALWPSIPWMVNPRTGWRDYRSRRAAHQHHQLADDLRHHEQ
jgi:hypothetical protein